MPADAAERDADPAASLSTLSAADVPAPADPLEALVAVPVALLQAATGFASSVLQALFVPTPGAPADSPLVWAVLALVRRQFANGTPVIRPQQTTQDLDDRQVHGTFGPADPDGDTLTYSVPATGVGAPAHGVVTIEQATNSWTYTPNVGYSGTDLFTVTASDEAAGYHIHGFGQVHTTTAGVAVTVAPPVNANNPPVVGEIPSAIDHVDLITGVVSGHVNVSDPDPGDTLTYSLRNPVDPAIGDVVVNGSAGTWTFTPKAEARQDAYFTPGADLVNFTIVATDGKVSVDVAATATVYADDSPRVIGSAAVQDGSPVYRGLTFSPDQKLAAQISAIQRDDGTTSSIVSLIDAGSGAQVGSPITIEGSAYGQFGVNGTRLLVIGRDDTANTSSFAVIDTATGAVLGVPLTVDNRRSFYQLSDDGTQAYIVTSNDYDNYSAQTVTFAVIDTRTGLLRNEPVTVDQVRYTSTEFSDDQTRAFLYTSSYSTGRAALRIIDTKTGEVVGQPVDLNPSNGNYYLNDDGSRAYLLNGGSDTTVSVIDTATGTPAADPIHLGGTGYATLSFSPDGTRILISSRGYDGTSQVAIINTSTNALVVAPITVDNAGLYVSFNNAGTRAFVTSYDNDSTTYAYTRGHLTVVDLATGQVVGTPIEVDGYPNAFDFSQDGFRTNLLSSDNADHTTTLILVDSETGAVVGQPLTVAGSYTDVTRSDDGTRVYLTSVDYDAATTTFAIVDRETGLVVGHPVTIAAHGSAVLSEDGRRFFLGGRDDVLNTTTFAVIDSETGALLGQPVSLTGTTSTYDYYRLAGTHAYLTAFDGAATSFAIVDTETGAVSGGAPITVVGKLKYTESDEELSRTYLVTEIVNADASKTTTIAVIDTQSGAIVGTPITLAGSAGTAPLVKVGGGMLYQLTFAEAGASGFPVTRLATIDAETGTLLDNSVISEGVPTTIGTLPIGDHRVVVLLTADSYTNPDLSTVSTIFVVQGSGHEPVVVTGYPIGFDYSQNLDTLYVTTIDGQGYFSGQSNPATVTTYLTAINLVSGEMVGDTIELGGLPEGSVVRGGNGGLRYQTTSVYAADGTVSTRIAVIDSENGLVRFIDFGGDPDAPLSIVRDRSRALQTSRITAADGETSTVAALVDTDTGNLVGQPITVPGTRVGSYFYDDYGLSFNADNSRAYLTTSGAKSDGTTSTTFTVIDTRTGTVVGQPVTVNGTFWAKEFSSDRTRVFITTKILDTTTGTYTTSTNVVTTGTESPGVAV